MEIPRREVGLLKGKILEAKYEAMLDFSLGDWMQNTKPSVCVGEGGGGGGGVVWMLVVWYGMDVGGMGEWYGNCTLTRVVYTSQ